MGKKIVCMSCNGSYDDNLPKCPYCGSTNIKGAEKEYMEKLEEIREDMRELDEVPTEELHAAIRKQGRKLRNILMLIGAFVLLAAVIFLFINRTESKDYMAEYLWQQEHYSKLNELYDSGQYDELEELYYELLQDENANMFDWEHYAFLSAYIEGEVIVDYLEGEAEGTLSEGKLYSLFYTEWKMKGVGLRKEEFTEQEYEALLPFIEISEADLSSRWKLTEEEYNAFFDELTKNGFAYVSYDKCEEFVKEWLKENR